MCDPRIGAVNVTEKLDGVDTMALAASRAIYLVGEEHTYKIGSAALCVLSDRQIPQISRFLRWSKAPQYDSSDSGDMV